MIGHFHRNLAGDSYDPGIVDCRSGLKRVWDEDRWSLAVLGIAALIASTAWSATTRPMGDSESYRAAGRVVTGGWQHITERTPGYPLLLWITGSLESETTLLFFTQMALHCLAVVLVLNVANRMGLPKLARLVVTVLLVMPPVMVKVVYTGSEALTEFLVVASLWLFTTWLDDRTGKRLLALGTVLGVLTWVRPTFQLVWLPVAAIVWLIAARRRSPQEGRRRYLVSLRAASAVALPAILIVASLVVTNGARFGQWGTTPMLGWFLGSRTSAFVQELPEPEPLRDLLVAERDRRLLLGVETDSENYQFGIRDQLSQATGLTGAQLDDRMFRLNVGLIVSHPFDYVTAVNRSLFNLTQMDAEPAASGPGRVGGWLQSATHFFLMAGFALSLLTIPGLAITGHVDRRTMAVLGYCVAVSCYVAGVSALVETGSPRLRAPTDALLVIFMVTGWVLLVGLRRPTGRLKGWLARFQH